MRIILKIRDALWRIIRSEISGTVGKEDNPSSRVNVLASYGTVKLY